MLTHAFFGQDGSRLSTLWQAGAHAWRQYSQTCARGSPEGQRVTAELAVGAGDVDVGAGLAERGRDVVAEAVPVHVAPLALHDVRQALGAEPQQDVALRRRRRVDLEALRAGVYARAPSSVAALSPMVITWWLVQS